MRYISKESKGANRCNNSQLHSQRDMVGTTCLLTEACLHTKLCYVSSPLHATNSYLPYLCESLPIFTL